MMEQIYLGLKKKKEENGEKVGLFKHVLETTIMKMKEKSGDFADLYQGLLYFE